MGKATIVSNLGGGEYEIDYLYDVSNITTRLSELADKVATLETSIPALESLAAAELSELDGLLFDVDAAILAKNYEQVRALTKTIAAKQGEIAAKRIAVSTAKLEKHSAEKEIVYLNANTVESERITAWCADYSDALTGDVGTIEIDGDPEKGVLIFPNGCEELYSTFNHALHGFVNSPLNITPANSYFNRGIFPAWQKHKPSYRLGTITGISNSLCSITLADSISREQELDVNQSTTLINVPFDYLCCDGDAFSSGDEVVIGFGERNWENPKVIGFKQNPEPCEKMLIAKVTASDYVNLRFTNGAWRASPYSGDYTSLTAANNWRGRYVGGKPTLQLSWYGCSGRYFNIQKDMHLGYRTAPTRGRYILLGEEPWAQAPNDVLGAAIQDVGGVDYIYVICIDWTVHRVVWNSTDRFTTNTWQALGTLNIPVRSHDDSEAWRNDFYFNGDGTKAVTVQYSKNMTEVGAETPTRQCYRYRVEINDTAVNLVQYPPQYYTATAATGGYNSDGVATFAMDYLDDVLLEATATMLVRWSAPDVVFRQTINIPGMSSFRLNDVNTATNSGYENYIFYMDMRYQVLLTLDTGQEWGSVPKTPELVLQAAGTEVRQNYFDEFGDEFTLGNAHVVGSLNYPQACGGLMLAEDLPHVMNVFDVSGSVTKAGNAAVSWKPTYYPADPEACVMSHTNQDFQTLNYSGAKYFRVAWAVS